ncbi:MAG: VanW family protein [Candidatus Merdisoma sp.]|jgi:vancomycin resistance protein YoaR
MRKMTWFAGLVLSLVLTAGSTETQAADASSGNVIHTGVYIDGIDVSGMTVAEAQTAIESYVQEMGTEPLTLNIGDNQLQTTLGDLGLSCTNLEVIEEAAQLGKTGNIIQRYKDRKDLEHENKNYQLEWTLDSALVTEYVNAECTQFDQEAVDATLEKNGSSFEYVAGTEGLLLDVEGSVEAIVNYIENEWDYIEGSVDLPVEIDEPRGSEEELSRIQDELGTYTTSFKTSNSNRSANIARGAELINGTVLYPGDTFSAYEAVSPFTTANGYYMAGSYLNGETVDSMGGGICQVSTTLYNAVIRAELEVVERSGHSMPVSYVDPAADAAIAGTYKDLKFTNNTDSPIYIEAYTSNKTITFTIYGEETRDPDRTIAFTSTTVSTTPPTTQIVADAGQPIGYIVATNGNTGVVAELYKHVYVDGVEQEVTKVNKTTYRMFPRTITVGVAGDETLSNELQAAIATQDEALVNATLASCMERMQ